MELSRNWKKECKYHEKNAKRDFEKKEEWYIENSAEELRRDTPKETLKTIDTTNQTSRNVNEMMLPARINIFYSKAPIKLTGEREKVAPKIINCSSKPLTERHINLLKPGLKFTPTPKPNTTELKSDIQEFTRKLQLTEFFSSKNLDLPRSKRSKFYPPRNRNKFLDAIIDFINQQNLKNLT